MVLCCCVLSTLGCILQGPKDPLPPIEKSGVYKLSCPECPAVYIGETSRSFTTRFSEHQVAYESNLKKRKSAFAEHLIDTGHKFDLNNCKPLHFEPRYRKRLALEEYEIHKHRMLYGEDCILNKVVSEYGIIPAFMSRESADAVCEVKSVKSSQSCLPEPQEYRDMELEHDKDKEDKNDENNINGCTIGRNEKDEDNVLKMELAWLESVD